MTFILQHAAQNYGLPVRKLGSFLFRKSALLTGRESFGVLRTASLSTLSRIVSMTLQRNKVCIAVHEVGLFLSGLPYTALGTYFTRALITGQEQPYIGSFHNVQTNLP
jgi:hypothetical protein